MINTKNIATLMHISLGLMVGISASAKAESQKALSIYSNRQAFLLKPLIDQFTQTTGISAKVLYAKEGLLERLKIEGDATPADVFISTNLLQQQTLIESGLALPIDSMTLNENIPHAYRDKDNNWFGLSMRGRVIYVNKNAIAAGEITDYLDLAKPKYRERICIRPWEHTYNVGLVAYMIRSIGIDKTEDWVHAVNDNLARSPKGNDRAQIRGANSGECDIAIANSYYLGVMKADPDQKPDTENIDTIFPKIGKYGTLASISAGSVVRYSDQPKEAQKLLEFLSSATAQQFYSEINHELPVSRTMLEKNPTRLQQQRNLDKRPVFDNVAFRQQAIELIRKVTASS